jgi:hypothetical protein
MGGTHSSLFPEEASPGQPQGQVGDEACQINYLALLSPFNVPAQPPNYQPEVDTIICSLIPSTPMNLGSMAAFPPLPLQQLAPVQGQEQPPQQLDDIVTIATHARSAQKGRPEVSSADLKL